MQLLTAEQYRTLEAEMIAATKPGELMELAGAAVVLEIEKRHLFERHTLAVVLCGKGNNGGDGWVVARRLHESERPVEVWSFASRDELTDDAKQSRDRAVSAGVTVKELLDGEALQWASDRSFGDDMPEAEELVEPFTGGPEGENTIMIDALLGSGLNRPVEGFMKQVVNFVGCFGHSYGIAIDIPSGVMADWMEPDYSFRTDYVKSRLTVVMFHPRIAHAMSGLMSDNVVVHRLTDRVSRSDLLSNTYFSLHHGGKSPQIRIAEGPGTGCDFGFRGIRHKGEAGRVALIAGSEGKTGAARLAGLAALRSGAGLVTLVLPASCVPHVTGVPEYMTMALPAKDGKLTGEGLDRLFGYRADFSPNVIALGPGMGIGPGPREIVRESLNRDHPLTVVLDADALSVVADDPDLMHELITLRSGGREPDSDHDGYGNWLDEIIVITPHPGEFARLTGMSIDAIQSDRRTVATQFARDRGIFVILKGHQTVIASPDGSVSINTTGNAGMATGGTGDVLTGMIAARLGRIRGEIDVSAVGTIHTALTETVYLHGYAGDLAAAEVGHISLIASDVIQAIPRAIAELQSGNTSIKYRYFDHWTWRTAAELKTELDQ